MICHLFVQNRNALAPLGTRAPDSRGTTPIGSWKNPLVAPTAPEARAAAPITQGLRSGLLGSVVGQMVGDGPDLHHSTNPFTRRLGSELRRASSGRGSQSDRNGTSLRARTGPAPPPCRSPSAYSSPSSPLEVSLVRAAGLACWGKLCPRIPDLSRVRFSGSWFPPLHGLR